MKYDNRFVTRTVSVYNIDCEVFNTRTERVERLEFNIALPKWSNFAKSPATRFTVSKEFCESQGYKFIELVDYRYNTKTFKMSLQDFINSDKIEIVDNIEQ